MIVFLPPKVGLIFSFWVRFVKTFLGGFLGRLWTSYRILLIKIDDLVKSHKSRHSCGSRSPELFELTGFPLPAFARTSFAGMTKRGPKGLFTRSSKLILFFQHRPHSSLTGLHHPLSEPLSQIPSSLINPFSPEPFPHRNKHPLPKDAAGQSLDKHFSG